MKTNFGGQQYGMSAANEQVLDNRAIDTSRPLVLLGARKRGRPSLRLIEAKQPAKSVID